MVKSAVKAMDAVTEFALTRLDARVNKFAIAGASKRGWVTWLVGAVRPDKVICIVPIVLDILHLRPVLHHMYRSLGGWTWAFNDYYDLNLTAQFDNPGFIELVKQVDPFSYIDRLTMPKLAVTSSNDEFMMLDDAAFWWDDLPGEKHLIIAKNSEHTLITAILEVLDSIMCFLDGVFKNVSRPQYTWQVDQSGGAITLNVTTPPVPGRVYLNQAETLSAYMRDFRWVVKPPVCEFPNIPVSGLCIQPIIWTSTTLHPIPGTRNQYIAKVGPPDFGGWSGFYVDVEFPSNTGLSVNYRFTTRASIQPVTYPFLDCQGAGCKGKLV